MQKTGLCKTQDKSVAALFTTDFLTVYPNSQPICFPWKFLLQSNLRCS